MSILVRFTEFTRYDITQDCEVVRFCASISTGTYHMEVPTREGRALRETRNRFKDKVADMIGKHQAPGEVALNG